jgi:hypothetical protein
MIGIAINVLWFLIGLIVLAGIVWLAIWVIEKFIYAIPEKVKQGIWVIVLLLALIALLTVLVGGNPNPFRHFSGERSPAVAALSATAARHLPPLLSAS